MFEGVFVRLYWAALGMVLSYLVILPAIMPPTPHLIGHGCVGAGGDIWAMEESDFPRCDVIEKNL